MKPMVCVLLRVSTAIRSRISLQLEIVALRHQLAAYQWTAKRPQIGCGDRTLWSWLARHWSGVAGCAGFRPDGDGDCLTA